MKRRNSNTEARGKVVGWLLIAAVAVLTCNPVHIHLLHDAGALAGDAAHVTHVHTLADLDHPIQSEGGHTLDPLGGNTLKSSGFHVPLFALLLSVLLLLPPRTRIRGYRRPVTRPNSSLFRHRTPPPSRPTASLTFREYDRASARRS